VLFSAPRHPANTIMAVGRGLLGELAAYHPQPPLWLHGADPGVRPFTPPVGSCLALFHGYLGIPRAPAYGVTVTVPIISGWMVQWYGILPAWLKVTTNLEPLFCRQESKLVPSSEVTVCATLGSCQSHSID
jgi:hypothetical protein